MKRIFLLTTALLLTIAAVAVDKVIQTSSRRAPKWIGGVEEEYIIVSAEAFTLELAKDKAITRVREQIIYAVATRVQTATTITMREVTDNGIIDSRREVNSALAVTAADIPYLADVSPTHAEDYYWSRHGKKTNPSIIPIISNILSPTPNCAFSWTTTRNARNRSTTRCKHSHPLTSRNMTTSPRCCNCMRNSVSSPRLSRRMTNDARYAPLSP